MRVNLGTYENQEAILNKQDSLATKTNQNTIIKNQNDIKAMVNNSGLSETDYRTGLVLSNINPEVVNWAMNYEKVGDILYGLTWVDGAINIDLKGKNMTQIANSSTAMNAIANSSTAMSAVTASSTAMSAVAASSTAITAIINSGTSINKVFNSNLAAKVIADSKIAMNIIANSDTAMKAMANSKIAMNALYAKKKRLPNKGDKKSGRFIILELSSDNYYSEYEGEVFGKVILRDGTHPDWKGYTGRFKYFRQYPQYATFIKNSNGAGEAWIDYYDLDA